MTSKGSVLEDRRLSSIYYIDTLSLGLRITEYAEAQLIALYRKILS